MFKLLLYVFFLYDSENVVVRLTLRNAGDGRTCIGDGYHCCATFSCVKYNPGDVFGDSGASYLKWVSNLDTSTIVNYKTSTTYETVTIASGTVTATPTSTQSVTVTNVQTVSVIVTTQAGTITVTVLTTVILSSPPPTTPPTSPAVSTSVPDASVTTVPFVSTTPILTHSPIAAWTGSGNLLNGYCTTPDYILLTGPTVYWAPFVGCDQNKPDCCPFPVVTAAANYPVPQSTGQATLSHCPDDYQTVSNGCCPS